MKGWLGPRSSMGVVNRSGALRPIFNAPLTQGLGLVSNATLADFTRATTASVPDFEGTIHTALSSESRFKGARRVENFITDSEDMTKGAYEALNNAVVDNATEVTFDGTTDGGIRQIRNIIDDGGGAGSRTFVFSAKIALVSGTVSSDAALQMLILGSAIENASIDIGNQITSTPQRFTVTASTDAAGTAVNPTIRWDDAGTLEITEWQAEETTGLTDTTTPSEYVSTGVESSPFHGANVDGVQYFNTNNGNTII